MRERACATSLPTSTVSCSFPVRIIVYHSTTWPTYPVVAFLFSHLETHHVEIPLLLELFCYATDFFHHTAEYGQRTFMLIECFVDICTMSFIDLLWPFKNVVISKAELLEIGTDAYCSYAWEMVILWGFQLYEKECMTLNNTGRKGNVTVRKETEMAMLGYRRLQLDG